MEALIENLVCILLGTVFGGLSVALVWVRSTDFADAEQYRLLKAHKAKTDEPVAWLYIEDGEVMFGHPNGYRPPDARPLVFGDTHPAPGVPDAVVRDAERYRWLRATTNWASSNGEHVDVRNKPELWDSAIDAAMTAAQAQKGQP